MEEDIRFEPEIEKLFNAAESAAQRRDLSGLARAYQNLVKFYGLLEQLRQFNTIAEPESPAAEVPTRDMPTKHETLGGDKISESAKERGEKARKEWIAKNLGAIALAPIRGALYRAPNGDVLGVPYAEEKENREGRWFLGLPAEKFHCAMLLCQPLVGDLFWINLPKEFISKHNAQLSKSKNGQVKFMLFKRFDNYYLQVPHRGNVIVTEYLNKIY